MNRRPPVLFAVLCFLLTARCSLLTGYAQSSTATLSGTVVDATNAVVPDATVTATDPATGLQRAATTNHQGYFIIPLLPPSKYNVLVEHNGFAPAQVIDVVLNVGDQRALQIQLKVGQVTQAVQVTADATTIRTDGSVGTVVDRQFVENMPLNGRSLQALIQLTPGVVLTSVNVGGSATGAGQFSVNGQRTTSNYFMVDGVSANTGMIGGRGFPGGAGSGQTPGTTALGSTNSLVSLDALQEFRMDTSTYAPEFGRTPGAQISLVTRGGTNQFHGSVSYYFRNDALDANDWFANATKQPKPKERQSFFGGVIGGPLPLPHFGEGGPAVVSGKNRAFFFFSYEGLRLQQPLVTVTSVATAALRAQALPALQPYLNALPLPNGQDFGNGTAQLAASYSNPAKFDVYSLRLDGRISNSLTGFFRVSHAPSETETRTSSFSTVSTLRVDNDSYTGGVTWLASSRVTSDVRLNWTRNAPKASFRLDTFGGAVIPNVADIFAAGRDPSNATFTFQLSPGGGFVWGAGVADVQRQLNAVGTVTWMLNSHELKLGVDYRRLLPLFGATGGLIESLRFSPTLTRTGPATFYDITNSDTVPREAIIPSLSLFAQDAWHAKRRLTLTYGLRFERVPPPGEANGRLPRTVIGIESLLPQSPRLAPQGTPLFRSRFGEFAPRLGMSYQLGTRVGWETTLRGGTGVFYDLGLGDIATAFQLLYPFFVDKNTLNVPFPLSATARTPPVLGVNPPTSMVLLDPNLRMPYTVQWNASLEQRLGTANSVKIAYVGAAGRRLLTFQGFSQSLADWPNAVTKLNIQRNLGSSSYRALQVQYQRRLSRGLQVLASYTLGSSEDNTSDQLANAPPASQSAFFAQTFAPSDFDVRHIFSTAVSYNLPKASGPVPLKALLNDWGIDILVRYRSAFPVDLQAYLIVFPDGISFGARPDIVPGQPLYIDDPGVPGGRRFNSAAFTPPPLDANGLATRQGNFPRNGLRGFPGSQTDLAVRREFKLQERVRLQLRGELFNLFNHPNFGVPNSDLTSGTLFGQPSSMLNRSLGGLNALYQMGGPRSWQFALKVIW